MLRFASVLGLSACVLCGCAKSAESIAPAYVSHVQYQGYTCQQLADERAHIGQALSTASQQQDNARTNDTVGVLLIGLPVSSLSGDNIAPQIAQLKGEDEAVRRASLAKNCH
jgi:hypothetical protein